MPERLEIDAQVLFRAMGREVTNVSEVTSIDQPFEVDLRATADIMIVQLPEDILANADGGNCFIATAAYGSYLEPEVRVLRNFRDEFLLTNRAGRSFVEWYYRNSPAIAAEIAEHEWMRSMVRMGLSPVIYVVKYPVPAIIIIFGLALFFVSYRRTTNWGSV